MTYTLANILSKTRSQSNQNPNVSAFPAAVEASYIDDSQSMIFDELLQYRPDILSHYYDLTTTGAERCYLPTYMSIRFAYEDILMVEDVTNSDTPLMTLPTDWQDRMHYVYRGAPTSYEPWSIRDEYIESRRNRVARYTESGIRVVRLGCSTVRLRLARQRQSSSPRHPRSVSLLLSTTTTSE